MRFPDVSQHSRPSSRDILLRHRLNVPLYWEYHLNESGNMLVAMDETHIRRGIFLKASVFEITRCSLLKINLRFGGICSLHLKGQWIKQTRNWQEAGSKHLPSKLRLTFNGLHGVITRKIEIFIPTTARTSNPTGKFLNFRWINLMYGK
jgi:hypothetical protein